MQKEASVRGKNRDVREQKGQAAVAELDVAAPMFGRSSSPGFTILGTTSSGSSGRVLAQSKRTAHSPCKRFSSREKGLLKPHWDLSGSEATIREMIPFL